MYIVVSHREELLKHSPSSSTMEFDVNGHAVNMTVAFEMDGIRINTKGVNADVLKYLRKNYGDGIVNPPSSYLNKTANDGNKDGNYNVTYTK